MKYTQYFSRTLKSSGTPHLDADAFAHFMNVVHLEGRIAQCESLINKALTNDQKFAYKLEKDLVEDKVRLLTNNREPKEFLRDLVGNN